VVFGGRFEMNGLLMQLQNTIESLNKKNTLSPEKILQEYIEAYKTALKDPTEKISKLY